LQTLHRDRRSARHLVPHIVLDNLRAVYASVACSILGLNKPFNKPVQHFIDYGCKQPLDGNAITTKWESKRLRAVRLPRIGSFCTSFSDFEEQTVFGAVRHCEFPRRFFCAESQLPETA
jgi:hypothetical protein